MRSWSLVHAEAEHRLHVAQERDQEPIPSLTTVSFMVGQPAGPSTRSTSAFASGLAARGRTKFGS